MENNDLMTFPLATLYGWRAPLFVTAQGVSDDAAERRLIQKRVAFEMWKAKNARGEEDFSDIL